MKALMIHVEKIVRPRRAMQFRKLRMRRELLAHLQAAFDEERAAGADEAASLERAKRRLGDPLELTRTLQQSVPWLEATLLSRVPGSRGFERLETRLSALWTLQHGMTMLHQSIVVLTAMMFSYLALIAAVLVMSPRTIFLASIEHPAGAVALNLINLIAFVVLVGAGSEITYGRALGLRESRLRRIVRVLLVLTLPIIAMSNVVVVTAQRAPTMPELARGAASGIALLLTLLAVAALVRRLHQPYAQWLGLDLAE